MSAARGNQPLWNPWALVTRLTVADPITRSTEGLDDACMWCQAREREWKISGDHYEIGVIHRRDCAWIDAMKALGRDIAPHKVADV